VKALILGAGGQLGAELAAVCGERGDTVHAFTRAELDVRDGARLRELVRHLRPDVVFNAAAYTAVDRAESEPDLAFEVNGHAVARVAQVCRDLVVPLVHYSSDYVFDGTATSPIPEDATPHPVGVYGRSKLEGEEAVSRSGADAWVVRSSWVYASRGRNFLSAIMERASRGQPLRVVSDQRGSPTFARDLARASRRLVEVGPHGVYHLTNSGECTWLDLARATLALAGLAAEVEPVTTAEWAAPAPRPAYSVLANTRWLALGEPPLRPWQEALAECVPEMGGA